MFNVVASLHSILSYTPSSHTNWLHVLFHSICKSSLSPDLQPGNSNLSVFLTIYLLSSPCSPISKTSQSGFVSKTSKMCHLSDLLHSDLSTLLTPRENLDILTSASYLLLSATVSRPDCITGLTPVWTPSLLLSLALFFHASQVSLSPPVPTCAYMLLLLFSTLSVVLDCWPQVFKLSAFFILHVLPGSLSFKHKYSVFPEAPGSMSNRHLSTFSSTFFLLWLQITTSSANIIVHWDSCLNLSL